MYLDDMRFWQIVAKIFLFAKIVINLHFRENVRDLSVFIFSVFLPQRCAQPSTNFHLHWITNKPLMYCLLIPFLYIYLFCSMVPGPFVIGEAFLQL
jgi:hypothetical protein